LTSPLSGLSRRLRRLHRRVLVRRRPLAALAAGAAVFFALSAATEPPPPSVPVWTAARDLPAGAVVTREDLRQIGFSPASVPAHALRSPRPVLGRPLAAPVGRGQPLAAADVVRPGLARGYPSRVAVPVRITDPAVAGLLRVGDHVALVAADPADPGSGARTLAADAAVLALPAATADSSPTGLPGRLVVLAVPPEAAETVATASAALFLTAVWLE
jgi:Flp pilus assembly protein CpaB